ncbi:MAG TPA: DUF2334 domain-containing protein [Bacilli bacterium]|nr:DUF2334 domain-containing protein [Bacilli bacterium]
MKKIWLALLLAAAILVPIDTPVHTNAFPNTDRHHALLRLEDISPGASYSSPEGLGRLRAVMEYLEQEQVPYHIALISRAKTLQKDGTWFEKGIDDPQPDEHVRQFITLLQQAERKGAVIGMHGYSHQYGDKQMPGNNQNTGTGFEFDVENEPETATAPYARERISKSLNAFEQAHLTPAFWESPHYHDTREQEEVFRSYVGLLYQPDWHSLRSLRDLNVYEDENTTGRTTLGSVYIPAPLSYVQNAESVTKILDRLPTYRGLAAMFYHPFLEFPFLEPVLDDQGRPVLQDGIPEYRYKADSVSHLHKLVAGFREENYRWMTLYDIVPFSPAHRIELPLGTKPSDLLLGDVDGDGSDDILTRSGDRIDRYPGTYDWPRNQSQKRPENWLTESFKADDRLLLGDIDGDGRRDLIAYQPNFIHVRWFRSNGYRFEAGRDLLNLPTTSKNLTAADLNGDGADDLLVQQNDQLLAIVQEKGSWRAPQAVMHLPESSDFQTGDLNGDGRTDVLLHRPDKKLLVPFFKDGDITFTPAHITTYDTPDENAQVLLRDTNGDGRSDVIINDAHEGLWQIYSSDAQGALTPLDNRFGPWARGDRIAYSADFDGNGNADIAAFDEDEHLLDLALSFRH